MCIHNTVSVRLFFTISAFSEKDVRGSVPSRIEALEGRFGKRHFRSAFLVLLELLAYGYKEYVPVLFLLVFLVSA